jgi:Outer membrane protein beta-barrel domain
MAGSIPGKGSTAFHRYRQKTQLYFTFADMKHYFLVAMLLLSLSATGQRFKAAAILGFNASQIDGDDLAGFNKLGFNVGGKAYGFFNERFSASFELLFAQKGSKSNQRETILVHDLSLTLNYAEIPLLFNYHDKNGAIFGLGFGYSRFLNYKRIESGVNTTNENNPVKMADWSFIADFTFVIKEHYGINGRYQYSMVPIAQWPGSNLRNFNVFNSVVSIRFLYIF